MPGWAYKSAQFAWSRLRILKNRCANLVDPPVIILVYHRVATIPRDLNLLAVTPGNFRTHMQFLKRNFRMVRFEEDWSGLREPAVAITFDDGYADNALEALPILEEIGVPATFFVSTGTLDTRYEFWWDELERLLLGNQDHPARFGLKDPRYGRQWSTTTLEEREGLYRDLHSLALTIKPKRLEDWLAQLRDWAGTSRTGREINRALNQDDLRLLSASRWATLGAHTVSHTALAVLTEAEQQREILQCRETLERIIDRRVTVFSYPFGRKCDYNTRSIGICKEAGFVKAAANFPGQAHRWTDPFQVPRQLVRNWDAATFARAMKSFWV